MSEREQQINSPSTAVPVSPEQELVDSINLHLTNKLQAVDPKDFGVMPSPLSISSELTIEEDDQSEPEVTNKSERHSHHHHNHDDDDEPATKVVLSSVTVANRTISYEHNLSEWKDTSKTGRLVEKLGLNHGRVSLFPWLDVALFYLPSHVTSGRSDMFNRIILCSVLSLMIILYCWRSSLNIEFMKNNSEDKRVPMETFLSWMFTELLPYAISVVRLHYYWTTFDLSLWSTPQSELAKTMAHGSAIWRSSPRIKNAIKSRANRQFGWGLMFLILNWTMEIIYRSIWDANSDVRSLFKQVYPKDSWRTWYKLFDISNIIVSNILLIVPNLFTTVAVHLTFADNHLKLKEYDREFSMKNIADFCSFDSVKEYIALHDSVHDVFDGVFWWMLVTFFQVVMQWWWMVSGILETIAVYTAPADRTWSVGYSKAFVTTTQATSIVSTLIGTFLFIFQLWPAMEMFESMEELEQRVKVRQTQIMNLVYANTRKNGDGASGVAVSSDMTMKNQYDQGLLDLGVSERQRRRTAINRERNELGSVVDRETKVIPLKNANVTVRDMNDASDWPSLLAASLTLQRLSQIIGDDRCHYVFLEFDVSFENMKDLVYAFLIGKLVSYMWDPLGGL